MPYPVSGRTAWQPQREWLGEIGFAIPSRASGLVNLSQYPFPIAGSREISQGGHAAIQKIAALILQMNLSNVPHRGVGGQQERDFFPGARLERSKIVVLMWFWSFGSSRTCGNNCK